MEFRVPSGHSYMKLIFTIAVCQCVVIIFFLVGTFLNTKHPYATEELKTLLDSKEFNLHHGSSKGYRASKDVYVDSEGVYRSSEDYDVLRYNEKDYPAMVTETPKQSFQKDELSVELEDENSNKQDPRHNLHDYASDLQDHGSNVAHHGSNLQHNGPKRKRNGRKRNFRAGTVTARSRISTRRHFIVTESRTEEDMESAVSQFSGMGRLKKKVSKKVKNRKSRFVADKRLLYSEVYEEVDDVEFVELLVIVSTSAKKRDRRDAIRASWWQECRGRRIKCLFFTDDFNSTKLSDIKSELLHERKVYKDVVFQPIDVGVKFGYRFLYQFQWAMAHYKFRYLLRVDDDVLMCLDHLLHDLKDMPTSNMQYGHLHCDADNAIYIDEGITMFSYDLVAKFLSQNPLKMRCHVFGDQEIATWINDLNLDPSTIYVHDPRIHHTPAANSMKEYFLELDDICSQYIAVHGVYPEELELFWEKKRSKRYTKFQRELLSDQCEKEISYSWQVFGDLHRYQPRYCRNKPDWGYISLETSDGQFEGREHRPNPMELWEQMHAVE